MPKKTIPFPAPRVKHWADSVLNLGSSLTTLNVSWSDRPAPPEALGNMLQHLARVRPVAVLLLENMVADMLQAIDEQR